MSTPSSNPISEITQIIAESSRDEIDYEQSLATAEKKDRFGDKNRTLQYKENLHTIVVVGMWIVAIILFLLIPIRAFHLVAPAKWHWLNPEYVHSLDAVLFSSIIFSLASRYFSYYKLFPTNNG